MYVEFTRVNMSAISTSNDTMISGFVAYRSGAFDSEQKDLSNNPLTDNLQLDSPPVKKVIMHSSKSGKVIEPNENTNPNKKGCLITAFFISYILKVLNFLACPMQSLRSTLP